MNISRWIVAVLALLSIAIAGGCSQAGKGTVGTACDAEADCADGLLCFNAVCVDPGASSSNCIVDAQCPDGSVCLNGKCAKGSATCQTDEDCLDEENCVSQVCVNSHNPDPDCETDEDCDDDKVCTKGACIDPEPPPTCETDEDCGENESCTEDGTCQPDEPPGCQNDEDCDQGTCDTETGKCVVDAPPCEQDIDCNDDDDCTTDFCVNESCVYEAVTGQGCCLVNEDCSDKTCMWPECKNHKCEYVEVEDCCLIDHDCEDGNALTVDTCENYQCFHELANCINDGECDDNNPCTFDSCKNGSCEIVSSADPLCCGKDSDCDDGNVNTTDVCVNAQCKFLEGQVSCNGDADCVDSNPCTEESCKVGFCEYSPMVEVAECKCVTDQDCTGNKGGVCGLFQLGPSSIVTYCTNQVGAKKGGALCSNDLECKSGYCVPLQDGEKICFGGCESDLHCDGTAVCGAINFGLPGQADPLTIPACVQPAVDCTGDQDCLEDEICFPSADPGKPNTLHTICVNPPGGDKSAGAICAEDGDCKSNLCVDLFEKSILICWAACQTDPDCPQGLYCYPNLIYFIFDQNTPTEADDKFYGLGMCAPYLGSFHPCGADTDCPAGEFCNPYANQTATNLDPRCVTPFANGTLLPGTQCSANAQCKSNDCANVGIMNICVGLCNTNNDCAAGSSCTTIEWQLNAVSLDVDICLP